MVWVHACHSCLSPPAHFLPPSLPPRTPAQDARKGGRQARAPPPNPPERRPDGNYTWGSATGMPWDIAAAGQRFVREHVRLEDSLRYTRCGTGSGGEVAGGVRAVRARTPSDPSHPPANNTPSPSPPPGMCSDLLHAYARLQRFPVRPLPKSVCYTGDRLLQQFSHPHAQDGQQVAAAYPWLAGYDAGCAQAEAAWGKY